MINIKSYGSGSSGNCYLVTNKDTNIILECGIQPNEIKNMLIENNLNYTDINACISSHSHHDHSYCIKDFDTYDIPCYCTIETKMRYFVSDDNFIALENGKYYSVGSIKFLAFSVYHGKTECYGFILADKDNMKLFITDFQSLNVNLSNFSVDEIFIECNYIQENIELKKATDNEYLSIKHARQINTHCSLENLVVLLKSKLFNLNKCKKINLIHISVELGDIEKMKQTVQENTNIMCVALDSKGKEI